MRRKASHFQVGIGVILIVSAVCGIFTGWMGAGVVFAGLLFGLLLLSGE